MQELFVPIVKQHGFEYKTDDAHDVVQLRTTAIEQAASAGDPWYSFARCNFKCFLDELTSAAGSSRS